MLENTNRTLSISPDTEAFLNQLTFQQKDMLYKRLWAEHVYEDVKQELENYDIPNGYSSEDIENVIDDVVFDYVCNCEYDCNMSYWDNIDKLIYKHMKNPN